MAILRNMEISRRGAQEGARSADVISEGKFVGRAYTVFDKKTNMWTMRYIDLQTKGRICVTPRNNADVPGTDTLEEFASKCVEMFKDGGIAS